MKRKKPNNHYDFCERVRNFRHLANMSIFELSEAANITMNTVVNIEKGYVYPQTHTIRKIAAALGTTPVILISGDPLSTLDIKWKKAAREMPTLFPDKVFQEKSMALIVFHPDFGVRTGFVYKMDEEIFWTATGLSSTSKIEVSHWAYANSPMT